MRPRLRADSIRPLMLSLAMFIKLSLSIAMGSFGSMRGEKEECLGYECDSGTTSAFKAVFYLPQNQNIHFFQDVRVVFIWTD